MTQNLTKFLKDNESKKYATQVGTDMHAKMQHVVINSEQGDLGDKSIIAIIKSKPELLPLFTPGAKTEVPIAGVLHGVFISRRIDRLLINHSNKTIDFIDYKTDVNKNIFVEQYKHQLKEYAELLRSAYPDYKINGYILWLNNWLLDKII